MFVCFSCTIEVKILLRIFLFQRAHIQYRDLFIFKHFAFTSKMSKNVLRFLWHGAYHVVVRGGSHFCQSPKSGGVRSFLIKTWGRANTFFWKKYQNSPALPPKKKRTFPNYQLCCARSLRRCKSSVIFFLQSLCQRLVSEFPSVLKYYYLFCFVCLIVFLIVLRFASLLWRYCGLLRRNIRSVLIEAYARD